MVELHSANVIKVPMKCEEAALSLVVPDLNLIIITSGHEERLRGVEVDASDGPVVLVEAVEEGAHAVVPHLDDAAVEAGQDPWAARVEGEALDPVALGLELGEHLPPSSEEGDLRSLSAAAAALAGGGDGGSEEEAGRGSGGSGDEMDLARPLPDEN